MTPKPFAGVFPIVATPFDTNEDVDFRSLHNLVDRLISGGSKGLVLLANASEGYALTEDEKDRIVDAVVAQVQHDVPVVVTVNEFSVRAALTRAKRAEAAGADAIMCMPPFFGQWKADSAGIKEFFTAMGEEVGCPLILQDHPLAGVELSVGFLGELLDQVPAIQYLKIEVANPPRKVRAVLSSVGPGRVGIFGGLGGLLFPSELESGVCGTMPSSCYPDVLSAVYSLFVSVDRERATELHARYLPLLDFELHCGGRHVIKAVLHRRGWIDHPVVRSPKGAAWDAAAAANLDTLFKGMEKELSTGFCAEKLVLNGGVSDS